MSKETSVRQTLYNLFHEVEEDLRLATHEYTCARLQLIDVRQRLADIQYLLEQYNENTE